MSQTFLNNFEYGSIGDALTTGSSGGGTGNQAFNTVTSNSANGGALTIDNTHGAARGTRCLKVVTGTSADPVVAWGSGTITDTSTTVSFREYLWLPAAPSTTFTFARWQSSGGTGLGRVAMNNAGKILLQDNGGTTQFTFAAAVPFAEWIRVEGTMVSNASTGSWEVKYFVGDSTSAVDDQTVSSINTNGAAAQIFSFTSLVAIAAGYTFWVDEVGVSDAGPLGPSTTPSPAANTDFAYGVISF